MSAIQPGDIGLGFAMTHQPQSHGIPHEVKCAKHDNAPDCATFFSLK
ncbi:hypothetical protein LTSEADE_1161 [Salmonella enterica subsp. enterica serovar Adelaide str. A4-669]|uniref:Uncharacterized protein n=1 Tax=Salmonella enterica subsp. enterica serovar Adelaide str. A4-669 TaxID=913063 RepID=A0A6C8GQ96_SALET|nr:hypothetical protein LTSEADE_1161 [Salmonella enterica subsp. enterica serovar Adelaide str. A4-669]